MKTELYPADYDNFPKTAEAAKDNVSKYFFTGKPCKNGHYELRRSSDGRCMKCVMGWAKNTKHNPENLERLPKDQVPEVKTEVVEEVKPTEVKTEVEFFDELLSVVKEGNPTEVKTDVTESKPTEVKTEVVEEVKQQPTTEPTTKEEYQAIYGKRKGYSKWYYAQRKDQIAEYNRSYYRDHQEYLSSYGRTYYQDHKEQILAYGKEYYQRKKIEGGPSREFKRLWEEENPGQTYNPTSQK